MRRASIQIMVACFSIATAAFASTACAPAPIGDYPEANDTNLPPRKGGADSGTPGEDGTNNDVDGGGKGPTTPTQPTLTVTLKGAGTVTSTPNGVTCTGTTCTGTFAPGTKVTLVPKPDAGSLFSGWTGGCTGSAVCEPTLNGDMNVTADFQTLDGTWTGTYTQTRLNQNCTFTNAGSWTATIAGTASTANGTGFEIRNLNGCGLVDTRNGTAPSTTLTVAGGSLSGSWKMSIQNINGTLDMPFNATIAGNKMTGTWTCPTCTGSFTLTKQ